MKIALVILFIALFAISEAGVITKESEVKVVEPINSTTVKGVEKVDELIRPKRRVHCVLQNGKMTCTGSDN